MVAHGSPVWVKARNDLSLLPAVEFAKENVMRGWRDSAIAEFSVPSA